MTPSQLLDLGPLLPQSARDIIQVAGIDAAAQLMTAWPGQEFLVPKRENSNPRGARRYAMLAEIVGEPAARAIMAHWGGRFLIIPNCKEAIWARTQDHIRADFDLLTGEGYSAREAVFELGIKYGVTGRCIDKVLSRPDSSAKDPESTQLGLF